MYSVEVQNPIFGDKSITVGPILTKRGTSRVIKRMKQMVGDDSTFVLTVLTSVSWTVFTNYQSKILAFFDVFLRRGV